MHSSRSQVGPWRLTRKNGQVVTKVVPSVWTVSDKDWPETLINDQNPWDLAWRAAAAADRFILQIAQNEPSLGFLYKTTFLDGRPVFI